MESDPGFPAFELQIRELQFYSQMPFVRIYQVRISMGGWVGLRMLDVRILVSQIIRTPRNPIRVHSARTAHVIGVHSPIG